MSKYLNEEGFSRFLSKLKSYFYQKSEVYPKSSVYTKNEVYNNSNFNTALGNYLMNDVLYSAIFENSIILGRNSELTPFLSSNNVSKSSPLLLCLYNNSQIYDFGQTYDLLSIDYKCYLFGIQITFSKELSEEEYNKISRFLYRNFRIATQPYESLKETTANAVAYTLADNYNTYIAEIQGLYTNISYLSSIALDTDYLELQTYNEGELYVYVPRYTTESSFTHSY